MWEPASLLKRNGADSQKPSAPLRFLLHTLLVGFNHFLDHLAAHGAGLPAGEVTVVALLQVNAHFPWCLFYIVNFQISIVSSEESVRTGKVGTAAWSERLPMNL